MQHPFLISCNEALCGVCDVIVRVVQHTGKTGAASLIENKLCLHTLLTKDHMAM
jgi:hypothetical protein